jgi:dihydrolipoamide dehydrogenase
VRILNSAHALKLPEVPGSVAVLGGGAVGCEFASIFASFGANVTLIELLPRLLPLEDEDVSKELARAFKKRGIKTKTGRRLEAVNTDADGVHLALVAGDESAKAETLDADLLLVAVGRAPVTSGLGLEETGVALDARGFVAISETMQSALPNVYAIGDVVSTPWLAHVASQEGILAVEHMAGLGPEPINYNHVPSCTYCDPEVASVGLSEAQAAARGHQVATGTFPLSALGKAGILQRTGGFVKVVRDTRYDELLGVHIVGVHATDLIAEACVALRLESTTEELMRTMHAHPTLSEAVMEAAHVALGHSLHI